MYYLKLVLGVCLGISLGWSSVYLTSQMVRFGSYGNKRLYIMVILLIKLVLYFIVFGLACLAGIDFMLSIAISTVIVVIAVGVWNFIHH